MAEGGAFMRGFGYKVEKETPRQMLGALEDERDLEREEERLEAEAEESRRANADEREHLIESFLEEFYEEIYPQDDGYDDESRAEPSPEEIVEIVRVHAGRARQEGVDEAIPRMGAKAMEQVLASRAERGTEFFDFRGPLRALNEIARICRLSSVPEQDPSGGYQLDFPNTPVRRLQDAMGHPLESFARMNQDFSTDVDRLGSPLFSERDIDTLGAHVTVGSLLRQSLRDVSIDEQRRAVGLTVTSLLRNSGSGFGYGRGPIPVSDSTIRRLHLLRKAFPSAKAEIVSRLKDGWSEGYALTAWEFKRNPLESLSNFRLAKQFARESGIEVDWKHSVSNLLSTIQEMPALDPDVSKDDPSFEDSQFAMLRKLVGDTWEYLPASIVSTSRAVCELLRGTDGLMEGRMKRFAEAAGIDWVPGEKWPIEQDVRALFAEAFAGFVDASGRMPWAQVDEIERVTGWKRMSFLPETLLSKVRTLFNVENTSVPDRTKLLQELQAQFSDGKFDLESIGIARIVCGPEAFEIHRRLGLSAEGLYARMLRQGGFGGYFSDLVQLDLLEVRRAFAEANGITPEQAEFLGASKYLPILERFSRAKELRLSPPVVTDQEFIIAIDNGSVDRLIPLIGKERASELIALSVSSLSALSYIGLAKIAKKERLAMPKANATQFQDALNRNILWDLSALMSDADLSELLASRSQFVSGVNFVRAYLVAKSRKLPVPEIPDELFESAVDGLEGDNLVLLVGTEKFSRGMDRVMQNDLAVTLTFFLKAAWIAKRHGLPLPKITDRLFSWAIDSRSLDKLLPIVPRELLAKGCATWDVGTSPEAYFARVRFSKDNGFSYPEMTPQLLSHGLRTPHFLADALIWLEPSELSGTFAGLSPNSISTVAMRELVATHLPALQRIFSHDRAAHQQGIVGFLLRLSQIQPVGKNPAHDPWTKELPALINKVGLGSPESMENFLDYLQTFGMIATSTLFSVHSRVYREKTIANVDEPTRRALEAVGVVFPSDAELVRRPELPVRGLFRQLKEIVDAIPARLLRGEKIDWLDTGIGQELFRVLLGETEWNRAGDSVTALQRTLEETERNRPELARVPSAFREEELTIVESRRFVDVSSEERMQRFLASREVGERFGVIAGGWRLGWLDALDAERRVEAIGAEAKAELESTLRELSVALEPNDADFVAMLPELSPDQRSVALRRREVAKTERGRAGLERQAAQIRAALAELPEGGAMTEQRMVEWIAAGGSALSSATEWLRELSSLHMARLMPGGMRKKLGEAVENLENPTLDAIDAVANVHGQYVEEHYLNPGQDPEHTGHPPYSKTALRALEKAWHLTKPRGGKLAIEELFEKGRKIAEGGGQVEESTVTVRMIPVSGLLRVYSGEIGDACYSSRHAELARGAYPNLNAWVYGTTDDQDRLKLQGSVLGLNLTTTDGMPTLVVRANNPKESFARSVDASSFVLASLREAVATARRQWQERKDAGTPGAQLVSIPLDPSRASCTNRDSIAAEYHRRFTFARRLAFQRTPEATFNNYDLTNPNGSSPCVEIWRIDADGKETWTGDWN